MVSMVAFNSQQNQAKTNESRSIRVPLVQVDIGLLADQVGVSATDTLDLGQGVHNLLLSIDVGVQKTQDLDETATVSPKRLLCKRKIPSTMIPCAPRDASPVLRNIFFLVVHRDDDIHHRIKLSAATGIDALFFLQGELVSLTNWKFVFSPVTSDMLGNCIGRCRAAR